jgi:hypothetical protein
MTYPVMCDYNSVIYKPGIWMGVTDATSVFV